MKSCTSLHSKFWEGRLFYFESATKIPNGTLDPAHQGMPEHRKIHFGVLLGTRSFLKQLLYNLLGMLRSQTVDSAIAALPQKKGGNPVCGACLWFDFSA